MTNKLSKKARQVKFYEILLDTILAFDETNLNLSFHQYNKNHPSFLKTYRDKVTQVVRSKKHYYNPEPDKHIGLKRLKDLGFKLSIIQDYEIDDFINSNGL